MIDAKTLRAAQADPEISAAYWYVWPDTAPTSPKWASVCRMKLSLEPKDYSSDKRSTLLAFRNGDRLVRSDPI